MACLKIMQWNAHGLRARWQEFKQFTAKENFDVICVQETFFSAAANYYSLSGFKAIRNDRPNENGQKGGLVTFVKNSLKSAELDRPQAIECQQVKVVTKSGQITVANVYLPPTSQPLSACRSCTSIR